jgi:hypothetical protein
MSNFYFDNAEKKLRLVESLINEMSDKELQKLMSRELQKIRLIPLDMFAAKEAISNIIQAENSRGTINFNRTITGLMSLDLSNVTIRNRFRFDNYYRRFIKSRSRGFDFEGLIAGLLDAEISESKTSPYDVVAMDGSQYSLKTLNKLSESPVLKSIKTNFSTYYNNFQGDEEYKEELGAIIQESNPLKWLVDSQDPVFLDIAKDILTEAMSEINGMLVGIPMDNQRIKMYYFSREKLIELGLQTDMINAPKIKGAMQIRFSSKIFKDPTISGELIFPDLSKKDYEDFLIGDDSTKRTIETLNNFGQKYGVNGLGRQLPQDIVMDLAKSEKFITDMNFILGSEE